MTINYWKNLILRPFAIFSFSFFLVSCITIPAGGARFLPLSAVFLVISLIFGVLCFVFRKRKNTFSLLFAIFMLIFGVFLALTVSYVNYAKNIKPYTEYDGKTVLITGSVTDVEYKSPYEGAYTVELDSIDGRPADPDVYFVVAGSSELSEGDKIKAEAKVTALTDKNGAPGEDSVYMFRRGTVISAEAESVQRVGISGFSPVAFAGKVRDAVSDKLVSLLGLKEGGFCAALFLGDREVLPDDVSGDFRILGISHILALSGLHLSVLCGFVYLVTKRKNIYLTRLLQLVVVVFYMLITGFSVTVVRAGLMLIAVLAAQTVGRGWDMITDIGLAAFIICIVDPFSAADIGLQLSVAAVSALALSSKSVKSLSADDASEASAAGRIKNRLKRLGQGIYLGFCVGVFILPLQWMYFTRISPVSPILSVVISLFATVLLFLFPVLLAFMYVPFWCDVIAVPVRLICRAVFGITDFFARIPGISVSIIYPAGLAICLLCFAAFLVFSLSVKKVKTVSGIVCLALFASLAAGGYIYPYTSRNIAWVDYINKGKNDAVSVCTDNTSVIIDVGNGSASALSECAQTVIDRGFCDIEYLVLTHTHNRHPGAVSYFFDKYLVRNLYVPLEADGDVLTEDFRQLCMDKHVNIFEYTPGEVLTFSENLSVATHEETFVRRSKQPVICFDVTAWGKKISYLGAAATEGTPVTLDCDTVIFGAHGPVYKKTADADYASGFSVIASDYADEFSPFARQKDSFVRIVGEKK